MFLSTLGRSLKSFSHLRVEAPMGFLYQGVNVAGPWQVLGDPSPPGSHLSWEDGSFSATVFLNNDYCYLLGLTQAQLKTVTQCQAESWLEESCRNPDAKGKGSLEISQLWKFWYTNWWHGIFTRSINLSITRRRTLNHARFYHLFPPMG